MCSCGVIWNQSEWRKDPDTGKRLRIKRPQSEWITHLDESLRIVSDAQWNQAQKRLRPEAKPRCGGKPKYLLSGLLTCDKCGGLTNVGVNGAMYGCSSHVNGGACSNDVRVTRDSLEHPAGSDQQ
jgi:site-specific DNA recombinase